MNATLTRSPVAPDPRIAERRRSVDAERRRMRRRFGAGALVVVSLVGVAWLAVHSSALDVDAIEVTGGVQLGADEVVAASAIATGDALLRLDTDGAARAVETLAWVDSATVTRSLLDGTVRIEVTERVPVAAIPIDGGGAVALVDPSGMVLAPWPDTAGLPVVADVVPGRPGERLAPVDRGAVAVAAALPPGLASRVVAVRPGADGGVELELRGAGRARLGDPDDLEVKVRTLQTVLATVDLTCVATIDVASGETAVLTRGESCA